MQDMLRPTQWLLYPRALWSLLAATPLSATAALVGTSVELPPLPVDQPFTFVVLGDNRGDASGRQTPAFIELLHDVRETKPAFVFNTGDMIYGKTEQATPRDQWREYQEAISLLRVPTFHVPGNHDIWDDESARLYQELWRGVYYSFDYGPGRFIGLDTESVPGRLSPPQFEWLERELGRTRPRLVFVFLHRPLFPADGAIGSSLDAVPSERDKLHRLFVQHRDRIKGIFCGHEHSYHFEQRDGVPYYITGGAGANLYEPAELGGFHHFLLARVQGDKVQVELRKVGAPTTPLAAPVRIEPGRLLSGWEEGLSWYPWDYTVTAEINRSRASHGRSGLQLNFDLAQNAWPALALLKLPDWNLRDATAFTIDVYAPENLDGVLTAAASCEDSAKHEEPAMTLRGGWNKVLLRVPPQSVVEGKTNRLKGIAWTLTSDNHALRGSVVFDQFAVERRDASGNISREILDDWEAPQFWRVFDESVSAELTSEHVTQGKRAIKLEFESSSTDHAILLAELNPPWDLSSVGALSVDIYLSNAASQGSAVALGFRVKETDYTAPPIPLRTGSNKLKVDLNGGWLPSEIRGAVEQLRWTLTTTNKSLKGWAVFDNLRSLQH
jgi:hypothetical protein